MAQLLSLPCADALKFRHPSSICSRGRRWGRDDHWDLMIPLCFKGKRRSRSIGVVAAAAAAEDFVSQESVADDYYSVLGLMPDATPEQIKKAYYNCMKACHPDLAGEDQDTTNFCMFINEVYGVLSDPIQRRVYDEINGYSLTAINPFLDDTCTKDHAFVDEFSCIGCKNCANIAPDVFKIEEDFGRARVCCQSGNPDLVQQAIETCPVDCIHWTSAAQVSLLEDEMRRVERVNVALMLAGMGSSVDVFKMAFSRWEKRQLKILQKTKMRMAKEKDSDKSKTYWDNLWGNSKNYQNTEEETEERAKRAAAGARRWREYSRRGSDRRPTFKLPKAISKNEN